MIKEHYPVLPFANGNVYYFISDGEKGKLPMVVMFEEYEANLYNLAFGVWEGGGMNDKTLTGNKDVYKVISTVAATVFKFTQSNPNAMIEILGVDEKRQRLYNLIFQRYFHDIEPYFHVSGFFMGFQMPYQPNYYFDKFVIQRKQV
jgi:hypothetical protein